MGEIEIKPAPDGQGVIIETPSEAASGQTGAPSSTAEQTSGAPTSAAGATGAAIDAAIQAWLSGHIYNSQVSAETAVYNHLAGTLPALKAEILARLGKPVSS